MMRTKKVLSKIKSLFDDKNDKKTVLVNTVLFVAMQFLMILYSIIRIFLINIYLGTANYGLLNLMISIAPISTILISSVQGKSMYVLYKYAISKNYEKSNEIINEQINEIRKYSFISFFIVILFMIFSFFYFKSPSLDGWITILLIFSATIEFLSYTIIVPYVQWYLNAIYKNYIYDAMSIIFSTFSNILIFILIGLYSVHIIDFKDVDRMFASTYMVLIISFLLTSKIYMTNLVLLFLRKKYMPWFTRNKKLKAKMFNKLTWGYFFHDILAFIATLMIPIILYILSIFINLSTSIAGIYYSYLTFSKIIIVIGMLLTSLRPYFAKVFFNENINKLFDLNKKIYEMGFILILFVSLNLIIILPYIMIFSNGYFSFTIAFLMVINFLFFSLKSIDENFIYIHGKPEKYAFLTLFEIIFGLIAIIMGFSIIFFVHGFQSNILNILYCLLVSEIVLRVSKFLLNIFYLNKFIYKISLKSYLKKYYKLHMFLILFILVIICFLIFSNLSSSQEHLFTNNINLGFYSNLNINILYNNKISLISWNNLILFLFFINLFFVFFVFIYYKFIEKNFYYSIRNLFKK